MELLVGCYETKLIQNTIDTPKNWYRNFGTHVLYCILESYITETGKDSKRIHCFIEQDDQDLKAANGDEIFTIHIDRRKRIHLPLKYMRECELENKKNILIFGYGRSLYIQSERKQISADDLKELEKLLEDLEYNRRSENDN